MEQTTLRRDSCVVSVLHILSRRITNTYSSFA